MPSVTDRRQDISVGKRIVSSHASTIDTVLWRTAERVNRPSSTDAFGVTTEHLGA